ncbi:MAG: hypothetical protein HY392_03090 [Candidatus Diapherotrites archaeon]|nr:hypothetical protein [Candidatus Diapherotrites archaeon]
MTIPKAVGFFCGSLLLFTMLGAVWAKTVEKALPVIAALFLVNLLGGLIFPKIFQKKQFFSDFHDGLHDFGKKANFMIVSIALVVVYTLGVGITWFFSRITGKSFLRIRPSGKSSWVDVSQKKRNFEEMF